MILHLLVCGYFNYPDINWTTNSCGNHCSKLFLDAVQDMYLFQHVETPTRFVQNSTSNVLDLVMTNEAEMIDGNNVLPALGLSDHICLRFNFKCYCSEGHVSKPRYNVHQADCAKMHQMIESIKWEDLLAPLDVQSAYDEFSSRLTSVIDECVPFETPHQKKNLFMT